MKKIIFIMLMAFSAIVVNAQTAVQKSKVFDNVSLGIDGGVATPLDFYDVLPFNPTMSLRLGKLFNPVVGAEIEETMWFGSNAYYQNRFDGATHNAVRGNYLGANALFNLTNLFGGYKGIPRTFEVSAVAGPGWVHTFIPNHDDKYENHLGAKTGLDLAFNVGKEKAHTINLRPALLWNLSVPGSKYGQLAFNKHGAQLYLGVGYTYHFKTSNGTHHFKLYDVGAMKKEITNLKRELAKKPTKVEVVKEVVKEVVNTKVIDGTEHVVYFAQNSSVLTIDARDILDNVKGTVRIDAYASPEGTDQYNKQLSQRRANVVAEYLRAKGVTVTEAVGHGVVGEASNRVAIVSVQ